MAMTSATQDGSELRPALHLQQSTVDDIIETLGKDFDRSQLQNRIEHVLSHNQRANEDLKQFFVDLLPTLKDAVKDAAKTTNHIEISGPVQGLIVNPEHSTIDQTFNSFLPNSAK